MYKDKCQKATGENAECEWETHHEATSLLLLLVDHLRRVAHVDPSRVAVRQSEQSHVQQAEQVR